MTNEEMALEVQRGNTEMMSPLWEAVERFVWKEAGRWARAWERLDDVQDLVQSGFLALYGACEANQPERGKFITWYALYLKTAFSEALGVRTSKRDPLQNAASLDTPLSWDDPEGDTLADAVPGPDLIADAERRVYLEQLQEAVSALLDTLPEEEQAVIRSRYLRGQTYQATADTLGADANAVRRLENQAMKTLRKPKVNRELRQFLDDRTDFYGLHGVHAVEGAVVYRERLAQSGNTEK